MNSAELPRLVLIILLLCYFYNSILQQIEINAKAPAAEEVNMQPESMEGFYADGKQTEEAPNNGGD